MDLCGQQSRSVYSNPNAKSHGPPPLLKKSLNDYFEDRIRENVQPYEYIYQNVYYAPSSEATVARHEIACLDSQLVHARNSWTQDKKGLSERWKVAVQRHDDIFNNLPHLNYYFKETFAKRERAFRNTAREKEQILIKEREIRRQKKDVHKLEEVKHDVENRLEKFSIFKSYLEKATEASHGEYQDIKELIDRYGVLALARDTLKTNNETFRDTVTKRQRALDDDVLMKSNEVLAYRNYLSELMEYDTVLQERVFRLDDSLLRIKTTAAQRTLIIGQVKMAIYNLYHQVCKSLQRHAKLRHEDTLGQLLDIRISVKEMSRLSRDIRRMLKAAHLTAKAEAAAQAKLKKLNEERQRRVDKLAKKETLDVRSLFQLPTLKNKTPDVSKILMDALTERAKTTTTATNNRSHIITPVPVKSTRSYQPYQ